MPTCQGCGAVPHSGGWKWKGEQLYITLTDDIKPFRASKSIPFENRDKLKAKLDLLES